MLSIISLHILHCPKLNDATGHAEHECMKPLCAVLVSATPASAVMAVLLCLQVASTLNAGPTATSRTQHSRTARPVSAPGASRCKWARRTLLYCMHSAVHWCAAS